MRELDALPTPSSALLVRMIMRKGGLFRTGKLVYDEIGLHARGCGASRATRLAG